MTYLILKDFFYGKANEINCDCKDAEHRPQRIEAESFEKPAMDNMLETARHPACQAGNASNGMEGAFVKTGQTGRH